MGNRFKGILHQWRTYGEGSNGILGPLPTTKQGNKYILVIMDLLTKWTEAIAIPNLESSTICTAFVDNFITKFGTPITGTFGPGTLLPIRHF